MDLLRAVLLTTDLIVSSVCVWAGFTWACIFLGAVAYPIIFRTYEFDQTALGLLQMYVPHLYDCQTEIRTLIIGALIGSVSNLHQDRLYKAAVARNAGQGEPEFRLYYSMVGALAFAGSSFGIAWTARPTIHWSVPALFIIARAWSTFTVYTGIL